MRTPKLLVLDPDHDLYKQVDHATRSLRPRPTVVACETFEQVDQALAESNPVDLLIAGPLLTGAPDLQRLRQLRGHHPETQLVLAVDRWRTASLRDTVRTGALDLLRLPVTDEVLLETVEQALEIGVGSLVTKPGVERREPDQEEGSVIAVMSATGGCGKTFFATNLAYHLQSRLHKRTCLIDLDLQFGELSTALRLRPKSTIADLLSTDTTDDDFVHRFEEHLALHDTGIRVLAGPEAPGEADMIDPADIGRLIEVARSRFDYVIIDTPAALTEPVLVGLEHTNQVFAMATLDLPSVRNLGVLLATLRQLKVPDEQVKLILNKVEPDVGIDVARVASYFPQGFALTIPYGRDVNRSLNMGQPVLAYSPRGEVSRALESGLGDSTVVGAGDQAQAPPRSRLGWLHRRSA